jgi:hypothetical protein
MNRHLATPLLALTLTSAWADRPLVSETADAIDKGACQIEAALARSSLGKAPSIRTAGGIFSCGIGISTQLAAGWSRDSGGGESASNALLGGKTNLVPIAEGSFAFGVAYTLLSSNASGSWRREETAITALATREIAKDVLFHANLGWQRARAQRGHVNNTLWSLGVETVGETWFSGDLFGDDRTKPTASIGIGQQFAPNFSANVAYALGFEKPRAKQLSVGIKLTF